MGTGTKTKGQECHRYKMGLQEQYEWRWTCYQKES